MQVLTEGFIFFDRRRVKDTVAAIGYPDRSRIDQTGFLQLPKQGVDVLQNNQVLQTNSPPSQNAADTARQVIRGQMRFTENDNQCFCRIGLHQSNDAASNTQIQPPLPSPSIAPLTSDPSH